MKTVRNITLVSLLAAGVVSIPAYAHNWVDSSAVKGTITFTEPNQHGFDFASQNTSLTSSHTKFVGTKEKLDWALGLEHRLVDTPWTRIFLDYDHYETDESSTLNTAAGAQASLLGLAGITGSFGEYDIDADSVKLGMRHRVNHSKRSIIDVGAALSWIDVDRDFTVTQNTGVASRSLIQEAEFEGFGPYFDVTLKHYPRSRNRTGFNVQAYAGAGLLYSETHFSNSIAGVQGFDREKVKGVSVETAAKLALGWDYRMCNKSTLSTSLGYMFAHYTDAFGGQTGGAFSVFGGGAGSAGGANISSGIPFTRQGPYLEFKWSGANF